MDVRNPELFRNAGHTLGRVAGHEADGQIQSAQVSRSLCRTGPKHLLKPDRGGTIPDPQFQPLWAAPQKHLPPVPPAMNPFPRHLFNVGDAGGFDPGERGAQGTGNGVR